MVQPPERLVDFFLVVGLDPDVAPLQVRPPTSVGPTISCSDMTCTVPFKTHMLVLPRRLHIHVSALDLFRRKIRDPAAARRVQRY